MAGIKRISYGAFRGGTSHGWIAVRLSLSLYLHPIRYSEQIRRCGVIAFSSQNRISGRAKRTVRSGSRRTVAVACCACLSDLPKIGGDEVGDPGRGRGAKLADRILNDTIRVRHALVLPEVLEP